MIEVAISTMILMFGGAVLTAARRWNNKDADAGTYIAGWTVVLTLIIWFSYAVSITG